MGEERTWKRIRERLPLHLPVRVQGRETPDFAWTEMTRLTNVTPFGAGFPLKRPTEKGRLLYMTIPMPRQLRVFDHIEDQYRIWGVVRHMKCKTSDQRTTFEVGVAFIGKRAPASYEQEPWKRYEISTTPFQSVPTGEDMVKLSPSQEERSNTIHGIAVEMRVEMIDASGEVIQSEDTVTENISSSGATLFTTLQIPQGRFIRLTSNRQGITTFAAIRSRTTGVDGVQRIHVEFIDREWPL
jgi:hypothetical protein